MKQVLLSITAILCSLHMQAQQVRVDGMEYWLNQNEHTAQTMKNRGGSVYTGDIVIPSIITYEGVDYTVTVIGMSTFDESTITSLTLPSTITKIGMSAFEKCTLEELVVPNSVSECFSAFDDFIGLKHLTLPYGLDAVDLSECPNLESLRINAAMPSKNYKFSQSATEKLKVYVPKGLKEVYQNAESWGTRFFGWQDLNDDNFIEDPEIEAWYRLKFRLNKGGHVEFNGTMVPKAFFGETVETTLGIKRGKKLELTFVPDDGYVKWTYYIRSEINTSEHVSPDSKEPYVLEEADKNLEIYAHFVAKDHYYERTDIGDLNYNIYTYNQTAEVTSSATKDELVPRYVGYNMQQITVPEKVQYNGENYPVTSIGAWAFSDSKTEQIIIPTTVTNLENCAFRRCTANTLEIPSSVRRIADYCFTECTIDTLLLPESMENLDLTPRPFMYIDYGSYYSPPAMVKYIRLPKGMTEIPEKMFTNVDLSEGIEMPETLISIGKSAFEGSNIQEIKLHEGLTSIGSRAFYSCKSLKSITIPASVEKIPSCLFVGTPLDTLFMKNPTPPEAEEPLFVDKDSDQDPWARQPVLVVPQGSKQLYQEAPVWSHFNNIIELGSATGITSLSNTTATSKGCYSLDGRRLTRPQKGINIIRQSDGTTKKVIVR